MNDRELVDAALATVRKHLSDDIAPFQWLPKKEIKIQKDAQGDETYVSFATYKGFSLEIWVSPKEYDDAWIWIGVSTKKLPYKELIQKFGHSGNGKRLFPNKNDIDSLWTEPYPEYNEYYVGFYYQRGRLDHRGISRLREIVQAVSSIAIAEDEKKGLKTLEGGLKIVVISRRERDQRLRKLRLEKVLSEYKKIICEVCMFDFNAKYGKRGREFVQVHHLTPLSRGEQKPDVKRVIAVCPNCHVVLHSRNPLMRPKELQAIIKKRATKISSG